MDALLKGELVGKHSVKIKPGVLQKNAQESQGMMSWPDRGHVMTCCHDVLYLLSQAGINSFLRCQGYNVAGEQCKHTLMLAPIFFRNL